MSNITSLLPSSIILGLILINIIIQIIITIKVPDKYFLVVSIVEWIVWSFVFCFILWYLNQVGIIHIDFENMDMVNVTS